MNYYNITIIGAFVHKLYTAYVVYTCPITTFDLIKSHGNNKSYIKYVNCSEHRAHVTFRYIIPAIMCTREIE